MLIHCMSVSHGEQCIRVGSSVEFYRVHGYIKEFFCCAVVVI